MVSDLKLISSSQTILAHGVHLTEEEMMKLSEKGTSIAHCPESNTCLKSGACDVRQLWKYKVRVGLGTGKNICSVDKSAKKRYSNFEAL